MSVGPGNQESRRIQFTGGSTFTLSLPKTWVEVNKLKAKDSIRLDWRPSGALRLTPMKEISKTTRVILKDVRIPEGALYDHLMAAYLSGVECIEVVLTSNRREKRKIIRSFIRSTRGLEIGNESEETVVLISLLKAGELPLNSSLNQMYLQLSSLMRDTIDVMAGAGKKIISDYDEREREVDGLYHLTQRQIGAMLASHKVAVSLGLDRRQAVEHSNLARSLERMMDHAQQLAKLIYEAKQLPNFDLSNPPMQQLPRWLESLKTLMINLRIRESKEIEIAREQLKSAQIILQKYENELWAEKNETTSLLLKYRVSESARRLCAYARDFGETLLNMMVYDQIITDDE